jgi:hypothetical protein
MRQCGVRRPCIPRPDRRSSIHKSRCVAGRRNDLAVWDVGGRLEEDMAERAGVPELLREISENRETVTLVAFAALWGLCLVTRRGWLKEIRSLIPDLAAIGIVVLALTGYWGAERSIPTGLV